MSNPAEKPTGPSPVPPRILIIEDTPEISRNLQEIIGSAGFRPLCAGTGTQGITCAQTDKPDLILLDLGLPDMSGRQVLAQLAEKGINIPVIIISAVLDMEERLACFNAGVDDFITKPFHAAETVARIKRTISLHQQRHAKTAPVSVPLSCGNITVDRKGCVILKDGKKMHVRRKVYDMICLFMENPGTIYNRDDFCRIVWNGEFVSENSIWVHISQVRSILEEDPKQPRRIESVPGFGYRFIPDAQPESREQTE